MDGGKTCHPQKPRISMHDKHIESIEKASCLGSAVDIKTDAKGALSISCFDLCNEHVRSVMWLMRIGNHASAIALLRSSVEALTRGLWVDNFSNPHQVKRLSKSSGAWPTFESMAKKLNSELGSDSLNRYMGKEYGLLSDFTHGTGYQIYGRLNGRAMKLKLTEEQLSGVFNEIATLSYISNICIAAISNDNDGIETLKSLKSNLKI